MILHAGEIIRSKQYPNNCFAKCIKVEDEIYTLSMCYKVGTKIFEPNFGRMGSSTEKSFPNTWVMTQESLDNSLWEQIPMEDWLKFLPQNEKV